MSNIFNDQKAKVLFSIALRDPNIIKAPVVETIILPTQPWIRHARVDPPGRDKVFGDRGSLKGLVAYLNVEGMKGFYHVVDHPPSTWALMHQSEAFINGLEGPDGFINIIEPNFIHGMEMQRIHHSLLTGDPVTPKADWPYLVPNGSGGKIFLKYNPVFETRDVDLLLYKNLLYVYLQTAEVPSSSQEWILKCAETLRDVKTCIETHSFSSGTLQGLMARMAECNRIRHGLKGHPKKTGLKANNLSFEDIARLLEVTFPIAQVDHTRHKALAGLLQKRIGLTTTPVNPDKLREKGDPETVIEALQVCEAVPWPQLPAIRPTSMAGPPFQQAVKKGEAILGSVAIFDNFMRQLSITCLGHLKDGATNPEKLGQKVQSIVNSNWFLFTGYIFPKAEVYTDAKYYSSTRYIYGASTPAFLSISAFLEPIVEQPAATAVTAGPDVTPSLYKFSPYKGKLDQVLAQSAVVMIDMFEKPGNKPGGDVDWVPRVGLIYADNLYFMTIREATRSEIESYMIALTALWPEFPETMRVTGYDALLEMVPESAKWLAITAWCHNNGVVLTYASVDVTKCEANVTQDIVQAFVYYMLTRGWVKDGAPYFNPVWMFYLMNIMPSMVVDCFGILYNQMIRIPGEGSGHGLTTQCNWVVSSIIYAFWMKMANPLAYSGGDSELASELARTLGFEFKVEYEDRDFSLSILECMLSSKDVTGVLFEDYEDEDVVGKFGNVNIPLGPHDYVKNLKLDLLGFDAVYSPKSQSFLPVLAYERLIKSFAFPKNEPRTRFRKKKQHTDPDEQDESEEQVEAAVKEVIKGAELSTMRSIYGLVRYHGLYLAGAWSNPMLTLTIQSRIKRLCTSLKEVAYKDGQLLDQFVVYAAKVARENDLTTMSIDQMSLDRMIQTATPPVEELILLHEWSLEDYMEALQGLKPSSIQAPAFVAKVPTNSRMRDVIELHYRELSLKSVKKKDGTKRLNQMDAGLFSTLVMSTLAGKGLAEAMAVVKKYEDLPKGATEAQTEAAFRAAADADTYMREEAIKAIQVTVLTGLVFQGAIGTAVPDALKKKRKAPVEPDIMAEVTKGPLSKKRKVSSSGGRL